MSRSTAYADFITEWDELLAALDQNSSELEHLEITREKLRYLLTEARRVSQVQALHTASKQEATRELDAVVSQGRKVATVLRVSVREHYGNRSEKLAEFRLQPFRGRPVARKPTPPPVEIAS